MKRTIWMVCLVALVALCLRPTQAAEPAVKYEANWESIDARPTPDWFYDAKFGIFIHWGVYSVPAWGKPLEYSEWYWRRTDPSNKPSEWTKFHEENYGKSFTYPDFAPMFKAELFNPDQWADIFKRAGAKYVVLTSKHHDGFCLWQSADANRSWGRAWNSVDIGPNRDLLGDLTESVRAAGIKMGFYYSLYEWFNPLWVADRELYVEKHMIPQFKDVVNRYKPSIIFSDGEWDMPAENWKSTEILAWLFNESNAPDDVVINDRWGKGARHNHGGYYTTEYGAGLAGATHAWEECRGMGHSFGYNRNEPIENYKSARELLFVLIDLTSRGGNLLLDIGPTADGRIPEIMQDRLLQMGAWLDVNGEAIHGTRPWRESCQWTEGEQPKQGYGEYKEKYNVLESSGMKPGEDGKAKKMIFFTKKEEALYCITPAWPGDTLRVKNVKSSADTAATMLGVEGKLPWEADGDDIVIKTPRLNPGEAPCRHAYTFKLTNVK